MADLVEVQVATLEGEALNWAVAKAEGLYAFVADPVYMNPHRVFVARRHAQPQRYDPAADWAIGGPLMDAHDVEFVRFGDDAEYQKDTQWNQRPCVVAYIQRSHRDAYVEFDIDGGVQGDTRLIAACRAIVAAALGATIQVPRELLP
ncbi:phage protein NinX family protein [Stutzerimonas nitrititolerans]|uniref:phage protein NinX family protein n=1 Tax=Stutzerimonas nitrititolerans TaxID=2482751 RepID=UPI0028B192E1|nr:phage protein NinX family protein [Stutzerimonas nitrititolerans]